MGQCFLYGNGGGSPLGYSVVCQAAEPAKKEGRIWVKSSVAMTHLEWDTGIWDKAPVGWVDIEATLGGDGPSSSNNTIQVFNNVMRAGITESMKCTPSRCRQVQGSTGNWVNVDAYVCHSDTWVQFGYIWNGELFDNGEQYTFMTGGWQVVAGELVLKDTYLQGNTVNGSNAGISTVNKIDITNYQTLHVIGKGRGDTASASATDVPFGVTESLSAAYMTFAAYVNLPKGYANDDSMASLTTEQTIDISSLTGSYYIASLLRNPGAGGNFGIKKAWLT